LFGRKNKKGRFLDMGYKVSRNPRILYRRGEQDGKPVISFVNVVTGEEWVKEPKGPGNNGSPLDVEVTDKVSDAAKLYIQCFAAVEKDFPELNRADVHKVASVLYKGLCYGGEAK
jgi:hypothetical protein